MADAPPLTSEKLAALRRDLVARALGKGLPPEEVEEVVDRALAKAFCETDPDPSVSIEQRVGAALNDERAEFWRRRRARPEIAPGVEPPDVAGPSTAYQHAEFTETVATLRRELGDDVAKYVLLKSVGHTERSIGEQLGWDPLHTGRIRRWLARNGPARLRPLIDPIDHKEAS